LIGEDQLRSFTRWHEPSAIVDLATLVVVPRSSGGSDLDGAVAALEKSLGRAVPILALGRAVSPAASHLIRQRFDAGAPVPPGWLPPAVAAAIRQNNWYGQTQPTTLPEDDLDDSD
jgi:nicotinic acid mononucleotide adenylyltransferase